MYEEEYIASEDNVDRIRMSMQKQQQQTMQV